jgi:hypothetical protein
VSSVLVTKRFCLFHYGTISVLSLSFFFFK